MSLPALRYAREYPQRQASPLATTPAHNDNRTFRIISPLAIVKFINSNA